MPAPCPRRDADHLPQLLPAVRHLLRLGASTATARVVHERQGCGLVMPGGRQRVVIDGARRGRIVSTLWLPIVPGLVTVTTSRRPTLIGRLANRISETLRALRCTTTSRLAEQ